MINGYEALKKFKKLAMNNEYESIKTVKVNDEDDELIISKKVKISIQLENGMSDHSSIGIYWEDFGVPNYRELGLYGLFKPLYNEITLDFERLLIIDSNGNSYTIDL